MGLITPTDAAVAFVFIHEVGFSRHSVQEHLLDNEPGEDMGAAHR